MKLYSITTPDNNTVTILNNNKVSALIQYSCYYELSNTYTIAVQSIFEGTSFETILGTYTKHLVTKDYIFYVNLEEGDAHAACYMFSNDSENKLISNNYFASVALNEALKTIDYIFISPELLFILPSILNNN